MGQQRGFRCRLTQWQNEQETAAALLRAMETAPRVDLDILDRLDEAQRNDAPPEDSWKRG